MSALFQPFTLKGITLRNRIVVAPMCQYSAHDGIVSDWHLVHLTSMARGGASLVIVEATAVSPEGRITPFCTGLWNDDQTRALSPVVQAIKAAGAVPGIQLGHAGRKASLTLPWEGYGQMPEDDPRCWQAIAPSAIAFGANMPLAPTAMTVADIDRVRDDFISATRRAVEAGFEWLELHFAHGYLAQSFLSEHANKRDDIYGGSFTNRSRFLLETLAGVREVWPEHLPLTIRLGVIEYDGRDEQTLTEAIDLTRQFKANGMDLLSVSIGFTIPDVNIPWGTPFLAEVSQRVREEAGIPVASAWGMGIPAVAEKVIAEGQLDLVMVGRAHLANPHWASFAAYELGVENAADVLPNQYGHWLGRKSRFS